MWGVDKGNPAEMAIQPEMNSFINWMYERSFGKIELLIGDDASIRKSFSDQMHPVIQSMLQSMEERMQTYAEELESVLRLQGQRPNSNSSSSNINNDRQDGGFDMQVLESALSSICLMEGQISQMFYRKMQSQRRTTGSSFSSVSSADQCHLRALKLCHQKLVNEMCLQDTGLQEQLVSKGLLTPNDATHINRQSSASAKNEKMLEIVARRMDRRMFRSIFLPELRKDCGHCHLADQLEEVDLQIKGEVEEDTCPFCRLTEEVDPKALARSLYTKGAITPNTYRDLMDGVMSRQRKWYLLQRNLSNNEALLESLKQETPNSYKMIIKQGLPVDRCCCSQLDHERVRPAGACRISDVSDSSFSMHSRVPSYETEQTLGRSGHRVCFIFDNLSIRRQCYQVDSATLRHTFEQFGFDVRISNEVTGEDMVAILEAYTTPDGQEGQRETECLVVVLLVHLEDRDCFLDIYKKPCRLDRLTSTLTASACPRLAGKPKIFILPASMGVDDMSGYPEFPAHSPASRAADNSSILRRPVDSRMPSTAKVNNSIMRVKDMNGYPEFLAHDPSLSRADDSNTMRRHEDSMVAPSAKGNSCEESTILPVKASYHLPIRPMSALESRKNLPEIVIEKLNFEGQQQLPSLRVPKASQPDDLHHSLGQMQDAVEGASRKGEYLWPPASRNHTNNKSVQRHVTAEDTEECKAAGWTEEGPQRVPDEADFLLAFATCPGYVMWTNCLGGSHYIRVLADVLQNQGRSQDLVTCLTLAAQQVANMEMTTGRGRSFKQIPCFISTLRKPVYL